MSFHSTLLVLMADENAKIWTWLSKFESLSIQLSHCSAAGHCNNKCDKKLLAKRLSICVLQNYRPVINVFKSQSDTCSPRILVYIKIESHTSKK